MQTGMNLFISGGEQFAHGLDDAVLAQNDDLLDTPSTCQVRHGPRSFLLGLEVSLNKCRCQICSFLLKVTVKLPKILILDNF